MMEVNQVIQGDCLEVLKDFPDDSVDLILTDIPYNVVNRGSNGLREFDKGSADVKKFDLGDFVTECVRVCSGSIYIFCGTEQVSYIRGELVELGLSTRLIVWEKTNPSPVNGQHIWLSGIELCVYGKKAGATFNEHCKNTVLRFPNGKNKEHPTQKNLELFKNLIMVSSDEGDLVLDPCIGSGTTAVACKQLGRKYIGIELEEEYVEIARDRLKQRTLLGGLT